MEREGDGTVREEEDDDDDDDDEELAESLREWPKNWEGARDIADCMSEEAMDGFSGVSTQM